MMNEKLRNSYLSLVRAALWGKEPAVWHADQTDVLMQLNAMQGTGPLVFPQVLAQEDIPAAAKMQMKGMCFHTMQQHVHLQGTLEQAWKALERAGIQPVLMKGRGLAAFYPEPQMRQWGDIDLFVGKEQYHPAAAVTRETFPDALKFDEELDHYRHYNLIADGVSIEVHRVSVSMQHPLDERRYERMERKGMNDSERLEVNGLEVRVPEATFNALFVFLHSWEHMMTAGANLRQICDLALLLHHYAGTIDKSRLGRYLRQLQSMDVWQLYTYIMVRHLGLPEEESCFFTDACAARAERMLDDLLSGRMVQPKSADTQQGRAPKNRLLRKIHTMRERLGNARRMKQYSPSYARHMAVTTLLNGARRLFAKDRHWE